MTFTMKKHFLAVYILLIVAAGGVGQTATTVTGLAELKNDVSVRRDGRHIPYIEAASDTDAYFAQGFVTASDRMFQMDLLRRLALGETAEIFGNQTLEQDKRWRRFNFGAVADASYQHLSPQLKDALDSYAKGVNAYIATITPATMSPEFRILQYTPREWKARDAIVIGKILADALSTTWRNDLLRASIQNLPKEKLDELTDPSNPYDVILFGTDARKTTTAAQRRQESDGPHAGAGHSDLLALADADEAVRRASLERVGLYAEDLAASNNWVISGKHTKDGKPILANDPHLQPSAPGIWYMTSLSTPTMRVSGVTVPGLPGIILGHNENIAWGATNVGPDVQDLYIETFNDKGEYKTSKGWSKADVRTESIPVRKNVASPATESVAFEVRSTRNGPVILEADGKTYSLKWTALDPKNLDFETFYDLNRAKNWAEFKIALAKYGGAAQNFVYADVSGNIGWYAASKIPIRKKGDGSFPYDAAKGDGEWTGYIPFNELPNLYNPASGLIVTANQRIVGSSYKYTQMSRDSAAPWRARRIQESLDAAKGKIDAKIVAAAQYDTVSIPHVNLARKIVTAKAASPETLEALENWSGEMKYQATGATIANEIRGCLASRLADENKPVPANVIRERILDNAVRGGFGKWLPPAFKTDEEFYRHCDTRARESLNRRLGTDASKWAWGNDWKATFPHPLDSAPIVGAMYKVPQVPLDGSGTTPHLGAYVSMRHIARPGNWDLTTLLIPLGQSGHPSSPHYMDQFGGWAMNYGGAFPFSKEAVAKVTKGVTTLTSRAAP